jgi:tRNA 2-thiouridine synthesizing protein A
MDQVVDRVLDCVGLFCPVPILKARDTLRQMTIGQVLEMHADDPAAAADMKSWAARTGHELFGIDKYGSVWRFLVRKTG